MVETAVVLLAGGEATRFPQKLEQRLDGKPVLEHCYDAVRAAGWPVYVAGKGSFSRRLDAHLEAPLLIDRKPGRGPLHAFLGACARVRARRIFAVGGDQPRIDAAVMLRLAAAWESGDEAAVPAHDNRIEPLGALYDRRAVLRAGFELRNAGVAGMRDLIARLDARLVPCDARYFHNVNRPEDLLGP
jgi:molybdopterin-guanine dinucleotide biosynthesis protein A